MRHSLFLLCTILALTVASRRCSAGDPAEAPSAAVVMPFSGKIVFHQADGPVIYEVTVTKGMVTGGLQHMKDSPHPIAQIIGGWYKYQEGRLVLLIQGQPEDLDEKWLSQSQHFQVDTQTKQVTLEHMLHGYGLTVDDPELGTAHVLDSLEGIVRLTGPE